MTRPISLPKKVLFVGMLLLACVLITECGLRLLGAAGVSVGVRLAAFDPLGMKYAPHGEFGYRQKPNASYDYGNGTVATSNSMSYRGPEVAEPKPPETYRIVLLGGSTTHGFGVADDETIDAHMRELLLERYPGKSIEVVNLAVGGYDAYQVYERMRTDGVRLQPDLVIINSGINDVRNAPFAGLKIPGPDRRTLIWEDHLARARRDSERGGPSAWTRLKHYLYISRLPGYVIDRLKKKTIVKQIETISPKPEALDYFEDAIGRTAGLAIQSGARVLFSTPPSALNSFDPKSLSLRGYWIIDAETTEHYRGLLAQRLRKVSDDFNARGIETRYLSPELPIEAFLEDDDCHLTSEGNRRIAQAFLEEVTEVIEADDSSRLSSSTKVK